MSVDTYLKGKATAGKYRNYHLAGVDILVANTLSGWAERVTLDTRRVLLWQKLKPVVEHRHKPT